ncbi:hypothetical protein QCA50_020386 [Cerrena zonata]|uniref:Uncharacterized protein n=1 Tax=Cerrena zonata TaxID=2478898 RepID=A0AAW0F868_9APHY
MSSRPCDIYAKELMPNGWGYALWQPELAAENGGAQIGDVGIIDQGGFEPFFNAHTPRNNPDGKTLPPNFETLEKPNPILMRNNKSLLHQGLHSSESVKTLGIEGGGETAGVEAKVRVKCTKVHGACLYLKDHGSQEKILNSQKFDQYIKCHYKNWEKYLAEIGTKSKWSDLVLITGTIKTSAWVLASATGSSEDYEFSFNVPVANLGSLGIGAGLQVSTTSSTIVRMGPQSFDSINAGKNAERNQTVFIHYMKGKPRSMIPGLKIAAQGVIQSSRSSDSEDEPDSPGSLCILVENTMEEIRAYEPLDDVLDYILEYSDVDVAFANTMDMVELVKGEWPLDMRSYLKQHTPTIEVIVDGTTKHGLLSIANTDIHRETIFDEPIYIPDYQSHDGICARQVSEPPTRY